jgi:hypothetical protein
MTKGIAEATSKLGAARTGARTEALAAIVEMATALQHAIGGERLRGLPNLATSANPYRALRVRARIADKSIPFPRRGGDDWGPAVLVLHERGGLVMVCRNDAGDFAEVEWNPDDIKAEDVEHVAETIVAACNLHIGASARATAQFDDLRGLAARIRKALEGGS